MKCRGCENDVPARVPGMPGRPKLWCSDVCRKRAWNLTQVPCPRCGAEHSRRSGHCWDCEMEIRKMARAARDEDIIEMWNEGLPLVEIKAVLGYGPNSNPPEMSRLMASGRIKARREGFRRKHEAERAAA